MGQVSGGLLQEILADMLTRYQQTPPAKHPGPTRDKGQSFLRGLAIIEAIVDSSTPLSAAEISQRTGIPRPSVVRLCQSLEFEGLVSRELDGRRYTFGKRLCKLASDVIAGAALRAERTIILKRLVDQIGETCNLLLPKDGVMVIADRIESNWAVRAALEVGTRVPLHCSASGKLFLASRPKAKRKSILSRLVLTPSAPRTITDRARLEKELDKIKREGVSLDSEGYIEGVVAVAVPITDAKGRLCAALSAQGTVNRFSLDVARTHIPALLSAAIDLRALLTGD
jgi:DNA-binding IclR family transcriptional regulator